MSTASLLPTRSPLSRVERQRWTTYYESQLEERLTRSIEYTHRCPPSELTSHFGSLLVLLRRTRPRPELHPLAVELIDALHPWPLRWAHWETWQQEIRFATRIYAHLNQPKRQAEFLGYLADVMFNTGRLDEAVTVGEQAIALARTNNAVVALAVAGCAVVLALIAQGKANNARHLLTELLEEVSLAQSTPLRDKIIARARLGLQQLNFQRRTGRLEEAVANASQIIAQLEALPDPDERILAEAYRERSTMQWAGSHYPEAVQDIQRAIRMFAEQGDLFAEADARGNLGLIYWTMTELESAEEGIRHIIAMSERLNARWHLTYAVSNLGLVYISRGKLHQALEYLQRAEALATSLGDIKEIKRSRSDQGIVKLYLGEYETAVQHIREGLEFAKEQQILHSRLRCVNYILLSLCYAGLEQHELALQLSEEALDIACQVGAVALKTLAWRCLAEHQPPSQRVESLQRALEFARQCRRRLDEAACLLSLASLTEDKEERDRLWSSGVHLLEEIGATDWLVGCSPENPPHIVIVM